ncbi:Di-copper centre-containing protein [Pleomassaria siparia CBS 279.74]|uniref:tyrosinase n=1 Tax=Pleomassaria siparia CBS 279.74 TaxID=1314801 RepID=A0A6G1K9L2_9PLEO|nr:Di-copper centre-containing protein [Pleomassaria siparia CBS 279.74]
MKTFLTSLAGVAISLSLLGTSQAASLGDGGSCSARQDDSFFSVVGVQGTGVQPRLELRELQKDTETWNLFIQAFARFQAMNQTDKLSYFQIAGIHGAPFGEWDGVKGDGLLGFCPHVSNLFGTWHRPYLALFEQILHDRAVNIANEFPAGTAREQARKAADKVRLPYWDWAVDPPNSTDGCMPASLRQKTTSVTFPNGTMGEIPNPLYEYDFHPLNFDDFSVLEELEFKYWNSTIRYPANGYATNATSRNDEVNARIGAQQVNNRDMLYKLLTVYQPFNEWSNKANGGKIGNIETLHDGIHNSFGLGNMGIIEVSAFDPVFWFHHANIDRLIAIYQTRYPNTYVEDSQQVKATYSMVKNSTQGTASVLAPFHMNAKGDMWTSTTSRNWESFGYTYPELMNNPSNDTLTLTINRLYRPQYQGLNKNNTLTTLPPIQNITAPPSQNQTQTLNQTADAIDWMCEVNMPTDIQNKMTYSVRVFLGEPNANPKLWATDKNYVGQVATLSSPRMDSNMTITANIVLTDMLAKRFKAGELKSLEKAAVNEYLQENFYWGIQQVDSTEILRAKAPKGLNVTVLSVPVHLPQSEHEVPRWIGNFTYHPDIVGKPPAGGNGSATIGGASGVDSTASSTLGSVETLDPSSMVELSSILNPSSTLGPSSNLGPSSATGLLPTLTAVSTVIRTLPSDPLTPPSTVIRTLPSGTLAVAGASTSTPGDAQLSTEIQVIDGVTRTVVVTMDVTVVETSYVTATVAA